MVKKKKNKQENIRVFVMKTFMQLENKPGKLLQFVLLYASSDFYFQILKPTAMRRWHTGSRQITEVKRRRAGLVPGWVTTREHPVL